MSKRLIALVACALLGQFASLRAGVDADPNKSYAITPEVGQWVICCSTYIGPDAVSKSHEMALEIRNRYGWPAWVFNKGEKEREAERERLKKVYDQYPEAKQQLEQYREQYRLKDPNARFGLRTVRIQDQCAVLVGGFKDSESASRALKTVKKWEAPPKEHLLPKLTFVEPGEREGDPGKVYAAPANPFVNSFVTRNPTVQPEKAQGGKDFATIKQLNTNESMSLLKCKKRYSLAIAAYQGLSTLQSADKTSSGFLEKLFGSSSGKALDQSAYNARELAEALRKLKLEAYVLHMRGGSIVTVGGFDASDDPAIQSTQRVLTSNVRIQAQLGMLPQPMLIEIPRP